MGRRLVCFLATPPKAEISSRQKRVFGGEAAFCPIHPQMKKLQICCCVPHIGCAV